MGDFQALIQQGAASAWLFIPSAILLGALHGLEPGHSKTMMAAFIVAVRGTVGQAVLLGLAATFSHTLVVWVIALTGLYFGGNWYDETTEPYFQLASGVMIVAIAGWMILTTWRHQQGYHADHDHDHDHGHSHAHHAGRVVDTGHGKVRLEVYEEGVPPRFRLSREGSHGHFWSAGEVAVETERTDGRLQTFIFRERDGHLESIDEIPEPHEFIARLRLSHAGHSHDYDLEFVEHSHHVLSEYDSLEVAAPGYQDPHELAHANDIRRRFSGRTVTTRQIIVFGLTGGLIPCPASITVLLLCLQLKEVALGATLVLCFSIGLALTMVASGTLAALSVRHVASRWSGFGEIARKAPYVSGGLILLVGVYVGYQGFAALA
ncbi:MAG: nickel/cobalt efflux transporter [Pseudomonadota bacterium]